ncbi:MAG: twin-arginine translocase subunit TatC [Planctomycetaceae bacterium]|jgi:sec-independent protein translocase protein TatC|nr:twin-arginine translocase subunit TatC [Planctomycetaceae bacterium]
MKDDSLFAESSMSIGEHLEELRRCIIYSICWVVVCAIFGFYFGATIVKYIQIPVSKSLDRYHSVQSRLQIESDKQKLLSEGYSQDVIEAVLKLGFVPEEKYIFRGELERILSQQRSRVAETRSGDSIMLEEADNLIVRKIEQNKKHAEAGFSYESIRPDEEPIRIIFLKKNSSMSKTKSLSPYEAFGIYIKVSVVTGILLALPFIAIHIWSFISAGLYPHEKRYVYYFVPVSVLLFIIGAMFAFFCVFQLVLDFLFDFNAWMNIEPDLRISEWIGFAFMLPVGFGVSFQLPVVMFVLERIGIFSYKQYFASWRISVFVIFVVSLMLTPGDPGSMVMMALPLTLLYFGGAACCMMFPRPKTMFDYNENDETDSNEKFTAIDS